MFLKSLFTCLASLTALPAVLAAAGQLVRITEDFGPNPTNVYFYIYVPSNVQANPPILVNPHWCSGTAQSTFMGTQLATQADVYGYIMIFPEADRSGKCWDISSAATLKHDAGGDSQGIVSMVKWTLNKYNGDSNRVFAMGTSSGAMMTNVLVGAYPDIFAGGSAWAGVAFACFAGTAVAEWNSQCALGQTIKTGAEWKALVEAAYPGYTGWRPKMQSVHGANDETVRPQNLQEQIKQWTAVLGYSTSPIQTILNTPNAGWTTSIYGDKFQAISAAGVGHDIQTHADTVLNWFDLKCKGAGCFGRPSSSVSSSTSKTTTPVPTSSSKTTTLVTSTTTTAQITSRSSSVVVSPTSTTAVITTPSRTTTTISITTRSLTTTTSAASQPAQSKWGQCGGIGWTGPKTCVSGSTCTYSNDWYSQCL